MNKYIIVILLFVSSFGFSQNTSYQIALLKYNGGGDWYANPTALPNLADFCNKNIGTNISEEIGTIDVSSP
ncbi:MAG: DUF4159 domain-containing protein, partial [Vicingaceae bacterium]|nr:DUF4159 domain-containing protein [Vicingaceae bacterium]